MVLSIALGAAYVGLPAQRSAQAQVKPGIAPRGGAPVGGVRPAVPAQNSGNFQNGGGGPNTNPNAPNNTPNGPNQNPNAPFANNLNGNMLNQTPGATIPLGSLAFGSGTNFPWYLPWAGYGYGVQGSPAWANTNGYYGVGSGGFGPDNLAGGQSIDGSALAGSAPPVNQKLPNAPLSEKVQERIRDNEALYQFSNVHQSYRALQIAQNHAIGETATRVAHESVPRVLSSSEFNGENGKIAWPSPLLADEYKAPRAAIEKAMTGLLGERGTENEAAIRDATREMVEILRSHIEELPADEYMLARKFLDSVEFTAHKFVARS